MKVASRDLYAILRERLAPELKAAGFKRTAGGMPGWYRPVADRHVSLWFQCDKYGWFEDFGSRFTLELQVADDPRPGSGRLDERERFAAFLSAVDLEFVRALNNEVLGALPTPSPGNPLFLLGEAAREWFLSAYRPQVEPYLKGQDVWLHYFTAEQAHRWAAFFSGRILGITDGFLAAVRRNAPTSGQTSAGCT